MKVLIPYAITDGVLTYSSTPEADYPVWYALQFFAAGARVIRPGLHRIYERQVAGYGSIPPEVDTANWTLVGPTNRWAMLDDSVGSSTTGAGSVSATLLLPGPVNDVVLMNVIGSTVTLALNGRNIRSAAVPASDRAGVGSALQINGLSLTGTPSLTVTVTGTGTVSVGTLAVGTFTAIGDDERGLQIGMQSYSSKAFDKFGAATVVKRSTARRLSGSITLSPAATDQCARVLTALRARPAVWVGLPWVDATFVYGIASNWSLSVQRGITRGTLSIRGLTVGL